MSSSSSSLEEELSIPRNALLILPRNAPIAASLQLTGDGGGGGPSIPIDLTSSLRKAAAPAAQAPRCLIVGRQASSSDIRVDHSSVSRRHAAFFYAQSSQDGGKEWSLYLKDCGGKKGTFVNTSRMEKNGTVKISDGDSVHFGNCVERTFRVSIHSTGDNDNGRESKADAAIREDEAQTNRSRQQQEALAGLSGRARREAEIAAMTASLDEAPAYTAYPTSGPDVDDPSATASAVPTSAPSSAQSGRENAPAPDDAKSMEEELQSLNIPTSHEVELRGHAKLVTSIAVDPAGSRMVTGSTDMSLHLWDFGGMDSSHRSFKEIVEVDNEGRHPIVALSYSNTGDRFVVCTTSAEPKVFDRDGHELAHFNKGDVYVTDMARTSGHTATVTGVAWHPLERDIILSCSTDGSARIWDLNGKTIFNKLVCSKVYRAKNRRGQRTGVTAVAYHPGGREFALGTSCGSIQIWSTMRVGTRPDRAAYGAHDKEGIICSLTYSPDGSMIASRMADDDTVRVWDARKLGQPPIAIFRDVPCVYESGNCAFSPNGEFVCVGTSVKPGSNGDGMLKFFRARDESETSSPVLQLKVASGSSVVRIVWHPKINQIVCGGSDGITHIFYDPKLSSKGALLSSSRAARKKDALDLLLASRHEPAVGKIITPNALPIFRDPETERKRKRGEERMDPVKTRRPEPPATGALTGGRTSASVNFTQFVVKSMIGKNKNIAGKDPREDLFKYSEGKNYVDRAYAEDVKVLADRTAEEEEDEMKKKKKR